MADLYVRNSLNYNLTVKFNMTLRYFIIKGKEGEHFWTLEIGTTHSGTISPLRKIVHNISADNLDYVIEDTLGWLSSKIDWEPLVHDYDAPYVDRFLPQGDDVSLAASVFITLVDMLPSAGIDLSAVKITLNNSMVDFDITNEVEITGDPFEYVLRWDPVARIPSRYM